MKKKILISVAILCAAAIGVFWGRQPTIIFADSTADMIALEHTAPYLINQGGVTVSLSALWDETELMNCAEEAIGKTCRSFRAEQAEFELTSSIPAIRFLLDDPETEESERGETLRWTTKLSSVQQQPTLIYVTISDTIWEPETAVLSVECNVKCSCRTKGLVSKKYTVWIRINETKDILQISN